MAELRMRDDILHRVHDFGHARLVVGPEQGRPVGGNERLADIMQHFREFGRLQRQPRDPAKRNVAPVIIPDDLRLDILAGSIGRRIHMGDKADGRHLAVQVGRDRGHHIAIFVQGRLHAEGLEFIPKHPKQVKFLGFRGLAFGFFVRLGIYCDIAQKAVKYMFHYFFSVFKDDTII